jgi:hypothetical protein
MIRLLRKTKTLGVNDLTQRFQRSSIGEENQGSGTMKKFAISVAAATAILFAASLAWKAEATTPGGDPVIVESLSPVVGAGADLKVAPAGPLAAIEAP